MKPKIVEHILSINWENQGIANFAAIFAAIGTIAAVITALWQSHQAKLEAERNRRDAIEATKEKINISNSILIVPPDFINFSIGITVTNVGRVPVYLNQVIFFSDDNPGLFIYDRLFEPGCARLPNFLPAGARANFVIKHVFLEKLARYSIEYCNENTANINVAISSNLEIFESKLNKNIVDKVTKYIDLNRDDIEKEISASVIRQQKWESENNRDEWLTQSK